MIRDRMSFGLAAAMTAMAMAAHAGPDVVETRPQRSRRRAQQPAPSPGQPHTAQFIGDGFDATRIERAELKRARKALKAQAMFDGVSAKQRAA